MQKVPMRSNWGRMEKEGALPLRHSHDYMRLDLGGNRAAAMLVPDHGFGVVGRGLQFPRVPGHDFIAKQRSLAIGDGRKARRGCTALLGPRLDHDVRETR